VILVQIAKIEFIEKREIVYTGFKAFVEKFLE